MSSVRPACPKCKSRKTRGQGGTKRGPNGSTIRRRICESCGKRFMTKEGAVVVRYVPQVEWL